MTTNVIGLGHVGEATLRHLVARRLDAHGFDVNERVVRRLGEEGLPVTADHARLPSAELYVFTTSTGPQNRNLLAAFAAVLALSPPAGALLSVESTLPPGTMDELARLAAAHGRVPGRDLYLAHVPHRVLFGVDATPFDQVRVAAGMTPACLEVALRIYGQLGAQLLPVGSPRVAELCKVVENALRFVEVAFAEALAQYCGDQGLPFAELREAVNTKPNVHLLDVDCGIGGECLPKDIRFLQGELTSPLLEGAIQADGRYRDWLFAQLRGEAAVALDGLTYKPGYKDLGFSQAVALVRRLEAAGVQVAVHDELFSAEELAAAGFSISASVPPTLRVARGHVERLEQGGQL